MTDRAVCESAAPGPEIRPFGVTPLPIGAVGAMRTIPAPPADPPCEVARQVRPPSRVRGRVEVGRIPRHPRGGPPAPASAAAAPPRAGRDVRTLPPVGPPR